MQPTSASPPPGSPERVPRQSGFTLLEVTIVLGVASVLLLGVSSSMLSSMAVSSEIVSALDADNQLRRISEVLTSELRFADPTTFSMGSGSSSSSMDYRVVTGWDGWNKVLSSTRALAFASGELSVDGRVIAANLTDVSFVLDSDGVLHVTLQMQSQTARGGTVYTTPRQLECLFNN